MQNDYMLFLKIPYLEPEIIYCQTLAWRAPNLDFISGTMWHHKHHQVSEVQVQVPLYLLVTAWEIPKAKLKYPVWFISYVIRLQFE